MIDQNECSLYLIFTFLLGPIEDKMNKPRFLLSTGSQSIAERNIHDHNVKLESHFIECKQNCPLNMLW